MAPPPPRYTPMRPRQESRPAPVAVNPRKVRGGVRVPVGDPNATSSWTAQRWLRLMEQAADGHTLLEGQEYAREGQTKRFSFATGKVEAVIQGRAFRPYTTTLQIPSFSPEQWDKAVSAMSEGAIYAAKLLSGELPANIEDVFSPLSLRLVPMQTSDVSFKCDCGHAQALAAVQREREGSTANAPWCKHAVCAGYLLASRLTEDPFLIFTLRGLDPQDLLERLRQRRAVVGAALGVTPIYQQRVAGASEVPNTPLDQSLTNFWEVGPSAKDLDLSISKPEVSNALLRRLGQSPWTGHAQFPLVGLLASCYDTISEKTISPPVPETAGE
jgi:uncharacterized Zn finger protein